MKCFQRVRQHLRSLAVADAGSAAIEYSVLLGLIAVALIGAMSSLREFAVGGAIYILDELVRITAMLAR